jgi:alkylation response protein AidB-like acyl-CoA dehydrogenase
VRERFELPAADPSTRRARRTDQGVARHSSAGGESGSTGASPTDRFRFYRDAKLYEIGAGKPEIRRLVIADEIIRRGTDFAY